MISFLLVGNAVALADPAPATPMCNALASVAGNLYLVAASGSPLAQFTSDGLTRDRANIAPDGRRIAWLVAGPRDGSYTVEDASGHQASFDPHATDQVGDLEAAGPLLGIAWSSADVLQLKKHEGPKGSRFEYHEIDANGSSAPLVGQTGAGLACAQQGDVACVQNGEIQVNGIAVFDQQAYSGTPQASVTVAKGATGTIPGTPAFTVQVLGFSGNTIGLQVTNPNGVWEKEWIPSGVSLDTAWKFITYSFTATLLDQKTGSVRVDEYAGGDQSAAFDPAIAWSPDGHNLLTVSHRNGQAALYLVRPGVGGQGSANTMWTLAAQVPLSIGSTVNSMRFISTTMLLLQTADGRFSELRVTITQGQSSHAHALTLGTLTTLPQTLQVRLDPAKPAVQGQVVDWACGLPRGQ